MLSLAIDFALELVAPSRCAACLARVGLRRAFCPPCALSVERAAHDSSCFAVAGYGGAMARAIARFKYDGAVDAGRVLSKLLAGLAPKLTEHGVDLVVPVPLHPNRLAERGFNQAALLARPLAHELGVPASSRALLRVRDTARQVDLTREERQRNVHGAFVVRRPEIVRGRRVVLVDDVFTSGATLGACAAALADAGAARVTFAVVARTAK